MKKKLDLILDIFFIVSISKFTYSFFFKKQDLISMVILILISEFLDISTAKLEIIIRK